MLSIGVLSQARAIRSDGNAEWDCAQVIVQLRPNCKLGAIPRPDPGGHPKFCGCHEVRAGHYSWSNGPEIDCSVNATRHGAFKGNVGN
jgi:hypothetical protein